MTTEQEAAAVEATATQEVWRDVFAHSLLDVIWHLLTTGEVFTDLGADYFTSRQDKEHQTHRLVRQLEKLGHTVQLTTTAT